MLPRAREGAKFHHDAHNETHRHTDRAGVYADRRCRRQGVLLRARAEGSNPAGRAECHRRRRCRQFHRRWWFLLDADHWSDRHRWRPRHCCGLRTAARLSGRLRTRQTYGMPRSGSAERSGGCSARFSGTACRARRASSDATGVSRDGKVLVGAARIDCRAVHAFRWEESTGMVDLGKLRRRREQSGPRRVGQRQGRRRMAAARRWIRFRRAVGGGPAGVIRRSGRASESCARVESGWLGDRGPTMPSRCASPGSERVDMALEQGREVPAASGLAAIAGHRAQGTPTP